MKIRRFFAKTMHEALNEVKAELGGDAVIMSNKKVADGVEIVAAYDNEPVKKPAEKFDASIAIPSLKKPTGNGTPTLSEIIGDSGADSLKELLEKQGAGSAITEPESTTYSKRAAPGKVEPAPAMASASTVPPEQEAQAHAVKPTASAGLQNGDKAIQSIQEELRSLRNVLQFQVGGLLKQEQRRGHPLQSYLVDRLEAMGVCSELAEDVVSYAPESANEREAWLFILKLLANRLKTTRNDILTQSGVMAFMGPTGTGKTTTIAKLAAQYAKRYGADQVALVTIDSYRIAAFEQLATYGKIIGCSVKKAANAQELSDVLYQFRNKRLVLIDTAGFGQRDTRLIKQLDTLNETSCANIKMYMVLQANTQRHVMEHTLRIYNKMPVQGCIFTKIDECFSLGEAISVAIQERLPVAYLTDGQKVPEDIKIADAKYIVSLAAKLYKKYELPHTAKQKTVHSAVAV
ncbi:flagellar biosynthesis protein FlhF [Planctobacterium marinum]|uniref:Flagellar biosynthesis protein FlhF n=1 Tax=Planctobacterium marinum TaxID=1631968 RepID=A0AA48I853_9ALTE|nr:flagellar biosynthesis regulator FlhF [Planctobacterium marinum]